MKIQALIVGGVLFMTSPCFAAEWDSAAGSLPPETAQSSSTLTLKQSFELALSQNESLKVQAEKIEESKGRLQQATSGFLPKVSWNYLQTRQDTSGADQEFNSFTAENITESRFTGNQTLFSGFKEFAGRKSILAERKREESTLSRQKILLFQDVASAFFGVLKLEADLVNVRSILDLSKKRVGELRERIHLGKSRETDLLSAESQLANLKARETKITGDLSVERETLSFLVGENVAQTVLVDEIAILSLPLSMEEALQISKNRSDLQASIENLDSKKYAIRIARADYWPLADLTGHYYTKRYGFYDAIDWDVILHLDVPIYQGGLIQGRVKEAVAVWKEAQLELNLLKRQIQTEVKSNYLSFQSSLAEIESLKEAHTKAVKIYQVSSRDYRLGLVNNLDVLEALNNLQSVRQALDDALVQSKLDWLGLHVAMEGRPTKDY